MVDFSKVVKVAGKYAGPVLSGVMTVMTEMENQKLKQTVKKLTLEVAELKSKMK